MVTTIRVVPTDAGAVSDASAIARAATAVVRP